MQGPNIALEVVQMWDEVPQKAELYSPGNSVTMGDRSDASFMLPSELVSDLVVLAEADGDAWTLCIPARAVAHIEITEAGATRLVDVGTLNSDIDGVRRVRVIEGMRARITLGAFSFFLRVSEQAPKVAAGPIVKWSEHKWLGASVGAHLVFLAAVFLAPPSAGALVLDLDARAAQRYIDVSLVPDETLIDVSEPTPEAGNGSPGAEGAQMQGEEGAAGAPDTAVNTGGGIRRRGQDRMTQVPVTTTSVQNMPMFASLTNAAANFPVTSEFGVANALSADDVDAYGDLAALMTGNSRGAGGFAMTGRGRGGCSGNPADCLAGAIGVGRYGTGPGNGTCSPEEFRDLEARLGHGGAIARCGGMGPGNGPGAGTQGRLGRDSRVPPPIMGTPSVNGGLSREVIRRVVQRNVPQVRHCFEQGLAARPDLEGRISMAFMITPQGAVQGVRPATDSLGSPEVAACVAASMSRLSFPPSDGASFVTYPFTFQAQE